MLPAMEEARARPCSSSDARSWRHATRAPTQVTKVLGLTKMLDGIGDMSSMFDGGGASAAARSRRPAKGAPPVEEETIVDVDDDDDF